jgi:hypothetical protein
MNSQYAQKAGSHRKFSPQAGIANYRKPNSCADAAAERNLSHPRIPYRRRDYPSPSCRPSAWPSVPPAASERTNYPRDVAEMALAHAIRDRVEAAYRRGDLCEIRPAGRLTTWLMRQSAASEYKSDNFRTLNQRVPGSIPVSPTTQSAVFTLRGDYRERPVIGGVFHLRSN